VLAQFKIMKTVLNETAVNPLTQPLFLGEDLGLQRYDLLKYPIFDDLYLKQDEFHWRPEEVTLIKDKSDYQELTESERFVFDSNIRFQTLGDSMLSRSILSLREFVTNSELEACMTKWADFEVIHSRSYSWVFRNLFAKPGEFFDSIYADKEIMKRKEIIRSNYDQLLGADPNSDDIRDRIYKAILSTNVMEGLVFYVSFACSFYFGYRGRMEGNAKIIKLIQRDEAQHFAVTQNLIKILRDVPEEGFQDVVKKYDSLVYDLYYEATMQEIEWAKYLFSKGSLLGLNEESLSGYCKWLADNRLRSLGYKKIFNQKDNPISGWLDSYMDSSKVQVAPQETEISSYKIGARNTDINESEFEGFSL
jgi:ribonucleoside-diphosphate reductase beta chain